MNSQLLPLVEELKRQVKSKASEIRAEPKMQELFSLHAALNALESSCGADKTTLIEILELQESMRIAPTEFWSLDPLDAAKRFLRKKGLDGAEFNEIIAALSSGGRELSAMERVTLRKSLSRSNYDVGKIGENRYTLLEFHPHVKRGRKRPPGVLATMVDGNDETRIEDDPDYIHERPISGLLSAPEDGGEEEAK